MAYVAPNSTLQLFKGINLDNRYLHTIYFANEAAQDTWFTSKATVGLTFNNLMYRRTGSNAVKVEADATALQDVTYLRFKNTRTRNKWYYAFVTYTDYVNENTAIVYYEIDVMQTWFIQAGTIRPCNVLREHVNDDSFGANLEAEPIGSDIYECDVIPYVSEDGDLFRDYSVVVNTSDNPNDHTWQGVQVPATPIRNNSLLNGTRFILLDPSDENGLRNQIGALITLMNGSWESGEKPIEVIDMFTFPTQFCNTEVGQNTHQIEVTHPANLGGYTPKNRKLFGYPYSFLYITTKDGDTSTLRWELFDNMLVSDNTVEFRCYGNPIGGGQIECFPLRYAGINSNIDVGLKMDNFPKNPFTYDAYQAWVASGGKARLEREQTITNVRGVTALASAYSSAFMGGMTGASQFGSNALNLGGSNTAVMTDLSGMSRGANRVIQGAAGVVSTAMDVMEAQNKIGYAWADARYQPNIVVGTSTPNLSVAMHSLDFYFFNAYVKPEEMKRLDDFLSCYGYAVNRVKQPNLTGRRYWNFVQTENAVIAGDMPASSKEAIGRIFDGGITFWHDGDQIGNYTQSVSQGSINNPIV